MIHVVCIGYQYDYEVKELLKLFFKIDEIEIFHSEEEWIEEEVSKNDCIIKSKLMAEDNQITVETMMDCNGITRNIVEVKELKSQQSHERKKIAKRLIKRGIFQLLKESKSVLLPWGFLTGVRPTKIPHEMMEEGLRQDEIIRNLMEDYFIEKDKALLLFEIAKKEHKYIYPVNENQISLYIGIPFCPTRCVYCSFPSNALQQWGHLIPEYMDSLCQEIQLTSKLITEKQKTIQTIYIGGGTPTAINTAQLSRLLDCIKKNFDLSTVEEITVEAGRPDTIDYEKMYLLKEKGVTRISVNPQTMNNNTLQKIGRKHTVKDFIQGYHIAREVGFDNINMDIIIGLPGEDSSMVLKTMEELKKLEPNSLTVHTLAVKRASALKYQNEEYDFVDQQEVHNMLDITQKCAREMGLDPYYLYRQKHILGNLENVGYSKPGYECIYNIQIMEEKQTIIGLGAGAVSKMVFPNENRLERVPNVKELQQYIMRVDEMVERKKNFL